MRLLLDTHTFVWMDSEPLKLSSRAASSIQDDTNSLFLSVVSIWEIQIKLQVGKLNLRLPLREILNYQQHENDVRILPMTTDHVLALENLPLYHKDPFDRMLISQASVENTILVTHDSAIQRYSIQWLW